VRLSDLESLPSFALLGPGFSGGGFLLITDLTPCATDPILLHAPFEASGAEPRGFAGHVRTIDLTFDRELPPFPVRLHHEGYQQRIEAIRASIAAGDVYQVCYTVRAELPPISGGDLLARMCRRGIPRFAAWVRFPSGEEFVSASPELFFELNGSRVHSEPMKGTARPDASGDLELSEKDRSELAMITDLVRNDLTPVCRQGSIHVECDRRFIELPYAVQTVSDVVGELLPGLTSREVLAALHPGGSVVGTPKRAALDWIRALETLPRGPYCGALGFVEPGWSVFSLLIRTAERIPSGWMYGVGGGIVYDSDPDRELDEVRTKLGVL